MFNVLQGYGGSGLILQGYTPVAVPIPDDGTPILASPPGGVSPFDVTGPNNALDLLSEPDAPHGFRDWYVLEAIQCLLKETGAFDDVYLSEFTDERSPYAGELKVAILEPMDWDEIDEFDDPADVQDTVKMRFRLTVIVRAGDAATRDREVDRLVNVAKNAIDGRPLVPGQTIPGWTKLRKGKWESPKDTERRQTIIGETAYWVDGDGEHDETE